MANRPRVPSTRSAKRPSLTEMTPLDSADAKDEGRSDGIAGADGSYDGASESLPDVKLRGEPVPILSREARIERAAYQRAQGRGFHPGSELDDWLAAEREVDAESFGASARRE